MISGRRRRMSRRRRSAQNGRVDEQLDAQTGTSTSKLSILNFPWRASYSISKQQASDSSFVQRRRGKCLIDNRLARQRSGTLEVCQKEADVGA